MTASSGGTASGAVASEVLSARLVEAALEYAALGWKVVPIHPGKKNPLIRSWQKEASSHEETIRLWWTTWPTANVGVQLGPRSGIIDIECDTPKAEAAYLALFKGEPPVTATYQGKRGKHRLFRWRDGLPPIAVVKVAGLEVRTGGGEKGAQSVFPPSVHPSGCDYKWLVPPDECPPAELPDQVWAAIVNLQGEPGPLFMTPDGKEPRPPEHWEKITAGTKEGERNESIASYTGKLLRGLADLSDRTMVQVVYRSVEAVNARNKPPLEEAELKKTFTSILKREQTRRTTIEVNGVLKEDPEKQVATEHRPTGAFRLVIVDSDPPAYELHAPQFHKAEGGCLLLTAEAMNNARQIRIQALKQAEYPLPTSFDKLWSRADGLYERLIFAAEHRAAPLEEKRHLVVADRLQTRLLKARSVDKDEELDARGRPQVLSDGSVVFLFNAVWEEMNFGPDKVTRSELSKILGKIGVEWHWVGHAKWKKLPTESLRKLAALVGEG